MWLRFGFILLALSVGEIRSKDCGSMNLQSYTALERRLKNCTAILGNLEIFFLNFYQPEDGYPQERIDKLAFPLREVTGYFMYAQSNNLTSLGNMFPNLTVIRGNKLFLNYALSIFESDLKELKFRNLLKIYRGSARIGGANPQLCLPPKIDWSSIIVKGKFYCQNTSLSRNCNTKNYTRCGNCRIREHACWDNTACQRFEESYLPGAGYRKTACHKLCLGDCVNETASGCYVCKGLSEKNVCVEKCSADMLTNAEINRCVTKEQCRKANRTINSFDNTCVEHCPPGYSAEVNVTPDSKTSSPYCEQCHEKICPKRCTPTLIRRLSDLEAMEHGCTIIDGDLDISFIEDLENITEEMQKVLGNVEHIWGSLKVVRSPPLTELTFLNNLKTIKGAVNKSAIQITENQNLQKIFDWDVRGREKLVVHDGYIVISQNNLLCQNETRKLLHITDRSADESDKVTFNGAKAKCIPPTIDTSSRVLSHDTATITWKPVSRGNLTFNAYIIQYVAIRTTAGLDQQKLFERDSCSSFGWQHSFVKSSEIEMTGDKIASNLTGLAQSTTYAYIVQTYIYGPNDTSPFVSDITGTDAEGAISKTKHFKTKLRVPSRVKKIRTLNNSPNSITIEWNFPENEAPEITNFYIDVEKRPYDVAALDLHDYCLSPVDEWVTESSDASTVSVKPEFKETCCGQCCERKYLPSSKEVEFTDSLVKLADGVERKSYEPRRRVRTRRDFFGRFKVEKSARNYTIEGLTPFSFYALYVYACAGDSKCGDYEVYTESTEMETNSSYDAAEVKLIDFKYEGHWFMAKFNEPSLVNGAILKYRTELYETTNTTSVLVASDCITRKQHENNQFQYHINNLNAGQYQFRVMAVSLAGKGKLSDFVFFHIEKPESSSHTGTIIAWILVPLVVIAVAGGLAYLRWKEKIDNWGRSVQRNVRRSESDDKDILMDDLNTNDSETIDVST